MTAPSTSSHVDEPMPWKLDRGRSFGEMGYLPGLDGLRGCGHHPGVLLYHTGIDWMPGGFLGVDVFFVISGFLITSLILEEYDRSGRVQFTKFYLGRARRLLPAVAVLLIAVGLAVLIVYQDALSAFREDALATVFYVNNWWYIFVDQSYFECVGRPPLLKHLWSLSVEEQFYLIWPVFALLLMRSGGRPSFVDSPWCWRSHRRCGWRSCRSAMATRSTPTPAARTSGPTRTVWVCWSAQRWPRCGDPGD